MIVDLLFNVVDVILGAVFALLPSFSLSTVLDPVTSVGVTVGRYLAIINGILPAEEIGVLMHDVYVILLPAMLVYKVANWVWRHIPELWGFGPGAG